RLAGAARAYDQHHIGVKGPEMFRHGPEGTRKTVGTLAFGAPGAAHLAHEIEERALFVLRGHGGQSSSGRKRAVIRSSMARYASLVSASATASTSRKWARAS